MNDLVADSSSISCAGEPFSGRPMALALPEGRTHGKLLAGLLPWLALGHRVYCLDGGNVFDPLLLARLAARGGVDPKAALGQIFVSRAYTCHQFLQAAQTMLAPLLNQNPVPVAIILQIDRLFHDEDIPLGERQYLFDRMADAAGSLHRRGLPLLLTLCPEQPNPWGERLARVATVSRDLSKALDAIIGDHPDGTDTADLQHVSGSRDRGMERLPPGAAAGGSGLL